MKGRANVLSQNGSERRTLRDAEKQKPLRIQSLTQHCEHMLVPVHVRPLR